jgi:hypothetical protein
MRARAWIACAAGLALAATVALADWLAPDPSLRDAQLALRMAARDTVGHAPTVAQLDSLAAAHLRLGDLLPARALFERVRALAPQDAGARAGIGRIALFQDDPAQAVRLLEPLAAEDLEVAADLFDAHIREGQWERAAKLAEAAGQAGRGAQLALLAGPTGAYVVTAPAEVKLDWIRCWPVPIVKARLNGHPVLFAVDTGTMDLLLDPSAARRCGVQLLPEQSPVLWDGTHVAAQLALAGRVDLGAARIERVPAALQPLRRWSLEANPGGPAVDGVVGANLLVRFVPTFDYKSCALVLRHLEMVVHIDRSVPDTTPDPIRRLVPYQAPPGAQFIPFELRGEREITVRGSLGAATRPMTFMLATGVPGCGVAAPQVVFDEIGVKPGAIARATGKAGMWTRGNGWAGVTVPTVTLGPLARDHVAGWSGAMDASELWRTGARRDALLCSDVFRGRRVTIDWGGRRLVIE